jgi:hypothetical protein
MDPETNRDTDLAARLRRLDASAAQAPPGFDYHGMLERHAAGVARRHRRQMVVRGAAASLVLAVAVASLWRFAQVSEPRVVVEAAPPASAPPQPRIVRADTYLALATLEDHIASVDDAITYARLAGGSADVARLERARAELVDSYTRVRYADLVSANF